MHTIREIERERGGGESERKSRPVIGEGKLSVILFFFCFRQVFWPVCMCESERERENLPVCGRVCVWREIER